MSAASKLPFVPDPVAGESFSGWLGRLARLYAGSAQALLRRLGLGAAYDGDRPHRDTLTGLARACGLDPPCLEVMTLGPGTFRDPALSRRLALSKPPQRLGQFLLFDGRRRFCPVCLDGAAPIWPLAWRAGIPICLRHRVWLERACGHCGAELSSLGPEPPARCAVCFTPFRTTRPEQAPDTVLLRDLSARIATARRLPAPSVSRDWMVLGQTARRFVNDVAGRDERIALAAFLAWADKNGLRLDRSAPKPPTPVASRTHRNRMLPMRPPRRQSSQPNRADRLGLLDGVRARVLRAVTEARRQLVSEGQGITERAWRRRADRLLRIEDTPESRAYGTIVRSEAPQSTG